jgi:hypothetical protein
MIARDEQGRLTEYRLVGDTISEGRLLPSRESHLLRQAKSGTRSREVVMFILWSSLKLQPPLACIPDDVMMGPLMAIKGVDFPDDLPMGIDYWLKPKDAP